MNTFSSYWNGKRVFVTGATGFVGSWLVRELVQAGAKVAVLARGTASNGILTEEGLLDQVTVLRGSVEDAGTIGRAIAQQGLDVVFHVAGQSLAGVAQRNPVATLETNVRGTWNVLEACRQASVGEVVVASSDKAYGAGSLPYHESDPLQGSFPYDVSKSCSDLICGMYANTYGLRVASVRCANVFGGGDLNFSRLIPDLIRTTLRGERFVIHSDGKFVRDFLYVRDAVSGYLTLAEHLNGAPSLSGQAFNFGLGRGVTVLEMVEKTLALMGMGHLRPIVRNEVSGEVRESYLSCEKANQQLGWFPAYGLEAGLRETISWYRKYVQVEAPATVEATG